MEEKPKKNHQEKNMAIKIGGGGGAIAGVVLLATATFIISVFAMKITRKRRSNKDNRDEGGKGLSFLLPHSFQNQSSDTTDMDVTQILTLDEKRMLESEDNSTLFNDPVIKREEIEVPLEHLQEIEVLADVHKAIETAYIDNIRVEQILESPILNIIEKEECNVGRNNVIEMQLNEEQESRMGVGDKEIICFVNSKREISSSDGEKITIEEDPQVNLTQEEQKEEECDKHIIVDKCQEDNKQQIKTSEGQETVVNDDQEFFVSGESKQEISVFEKHGVETRRNEVIKSFREDEIAVPILPKEEKECGGEIIKCEEDIQIQPIEEQQTLMKFDKAIEVDEIAVPIQPKVENEEREREISVEKCEENEKIQPDEEQETPVNVDKAIGVDEIAEPIQQNEQKAKCNGKSIMEKCKEDEVQIQQSEEQEALANYDQDILVSGVLMKSETCLFEKHYVKLIKQDKAIELIYGSQNEVEHTPSFQLSEKEHIKEYFDIEKEYYDGRDIGVVTIQEDDMVTFINNQPMQLNEKEQEEHYDDGIIVEETVETLPIDMIVLDDQPQMQFVENEEEDIVEIVEEDIMESNAEAIWPAESIQDASLLELNQLKEDREMKTEKLHLPENIGNDNFNGKKSFSERYMEKIGMQSDELTNVWKMRVWMWSMLMPLWCLCYCYFGLTFLKISCIVIFVFILLNFH